MKTASAIGRLIASKPEEHLPAGMLIANHRERPSDPAWILPAFLMFASIVGAIVKLLTH